MTRSGSPTGGVRDRTATRVVDAQHQAARTLLVTVAFLVAAPLTALAEPATGAWLPLHLFLVGGLLTAISGATQLLAVTWSASPAPADRLAAAQRWILAAGAVAVVTGREVDLAVVVAGGGLAMGGAIGLLAVNLALIRSRAGNDRFHPAIDAYLLATGWALLAVALGTTLAVADPTEWWPRIRETHLTIALCGLGGTVIAATLPYFVATQARTKMSRRATPPAMRGIVAALTVAVAIAAAGQLTGTDALAAAGYSTYAVALAGGLVLLPAIRAKQLRWAGPRLVQLGAGICWWIVATVLLAARELDHGPGTTNVLRALAIGGLAQILVASLAYFGPVLRGGGHERLSAGFRLTRSVPSLLAANTAALAALVGNDPLTAAGILVWAIDLTIGTARLLFGSATTR